MPKLRKMLGDIHSPECAALMRLIETQSRHTLGTWAVCYAKSHYLPLCGQHVQEQAKNAVTLCERHLAGEIPLKEVRPVLRELRRLAAGTACPVAQAAARAVATACAALQTPTNAFGYLLYGAAAEAYHRAGLLATQDVYDALATRELQRALASLQDAAVPNEPNPVHIDWNC